MMSKTAVKFFAKHGRPVAARRMTLRDRVAAVFARFVTWYLEA